MKKNNISLVLLCCMLIACSTEYSAVYQSVDAGSKWDESARVIIDNMSDEPPFFKVIGNKLYLMIRFTEKDGLLRTVVNYPTWDKTEMNRLLGEHEDIRSLVPENWNNWLPKGYGEECKT